MKKIKPIYWILLLGLSLRLISLNQSLWLDEAIQWWASSSFSLPQLVSQYIQGDFNPPLFHLITWLWIRVFTDSEISLRFPSVLFGLGTVYFVYKLGGFKAALLAATAPLLIYSSQEARMYSLAAFTTTAAIYFLVKRRPLPYILSAVAMLYSHYQTWLLLPILFLSAPLLTGIILVSLIPWLPMFIQQLQHGLGAATNPAWGSLSALSVKSALLVPIKFLIGRLPVEPNLFYAFILLVPLCLSIYLIFKAKNKLLSAWLFIPIILGALISLKVPVFSYFRFLFVLPAFYLLLTLGINHLPKRLRLYAFTFFMLINIFSSGLYLLNPNFHRENWREAVAYIHTQPAPVVIYSAVTAPFDYYDRGESLVISEQNLDQLINQPAAWYISYAQPIFDSQDKVRTTLDNLGFKEVSQRHFRSVTVIYYQNPDYNYFSRL